MPLAFHPRNLHHGIYDFEALQKVLPSLRDFVFENKYGTITIDFADPKAVKSLNAALLAYQYNIKYWDIPHGYLCPPIPGRADYIHYAADLLNAVHKSNEIRCLDIGTGANCIYPIIAHQSYGWQIVGSDIDPIAIKNAQQIIEKNDSLKGNIELRLQTNQNHIFQGLVKTGETFDLSICNPPFHASAAEAAAVGLRKVRNLKGANATKLTLNFGGKHNELWCEGGEVKFIKNMIKESLIFSDSIKWFTTLVSRSEHLKEIYSILDSVKVRKIKTIEMEHGQKISRIVAWTF